MAQLTQAAQTAAKDLANTPTHVVVGGIQTVQNALDGVKSLFDAGETSADAILDSIKTTAPTLVEPLLQLLHLSKNTPTQP